MRKILCPVDFSESSHEAMRRAVDIAVKNQSELLLVHVAEPKLWVGMTESVISVDTLQQIVNDEQANLEGAASVARLSGVGRVVTLMLTGSAAEAIVSTAQDPSIDLIVMGTHGRTGLQHAVLGSVAEKVVRLAPCDVLVTRNRPS